jgi:hypothetical protein
MNNNSLKIELDKSIGDEVIIICPKAAGFDSVLIGSMEICDQLVEVVDSLLEYPAVDSLDYGVLHGVLTKASSLPSSIPKGVKVFLLIMDESYEAGGAFEVKSTIVLSIAEEIRAMVSGSESGNEQTVDIEQVYIIYGYEVKTMLTVDESTTDDEVIAMCKELTETIPTVRTDFDEEVV